ncbi:MAG: twin-arginine translocation signal domain-containing protein, partial [Deltaproteobacteria bacterium]|nr:twin-arginine translocation signal domain-containing protein [Deltaproteobacteria bacterium]
MKAINRRKFLKSSLLGGVAATVIVKGKNANASATFGGYPDGMGVLVDLTRCVGCRSCEAACNKEQGLPAPAQPFDDMSVLDRNRRTSEGAYTVVNRYDIPEQDHPLFRKIQC